jgi:hypothetical protein
MTSLGRSKAIVVLKFSEKTNKASDVPSRLRGGEKSELLVRDLALNDPVYEEASCWPEDYKGNE